MATRSKRPKRPKHYSSDGPPVQILGRTSAWQETSTSAQTSDDITFQRQNANEFPPLINPTQRSENVHEQKLLSTLRTAVDQVVIITQKSGTRREGTLGPISEGKVLHITLKNVRNLSKPSSASRESMVLAVSTIVAWTPKITNGTDGFKTGIDIKNPANNATSRERELERWQPDGPLTGTVAIPATLQEDEAIFGPAGRYSEVSWDQFEANVQRFGLTTQFDEDVYTTKLDRNAPGYKERERRAEQIANEIMLGTSSIPHIADEGILNGATDGIGGEEKYSVVIPTPSVYVPPRARRNGGLLTPSATNNGPVPATSLSAAPASALSAQTAPTTNGTTAPVPTISTPAIEDGAAKPPSAVLLANFRDFVRNEKQKLAERKQAKVKTELDKRIADLAKFSKNFKLSSPIPEDLVPILAKDKEKQKSIVEKAKADAEAVKEQRAAAQTNPSISGTSGTIKANDSSDSVAKPAIKPAVVVATPDAAKKGKGGMFIQAIPPFNKDKLRKPAAPGTESPLTDGAPSAQPTPDPSAAASDVTPALPGSDQARDIPPLANAPAFKLDTVPPVFRPISPGKTPAKNAKEILEVVGNASIVVRPPTPLYGVQTLAQGAPIQLEENFNRFRHEAVGASQISPEPTLLDPLLPIQPPLPEEQPNARAFPNNANALSATAQAQVKAAGSKLIMDNRELEKLMEQRRPENLTGRVKIEDFHDVFIGGFSLVNRGSMEGRPVAIKRLKVKQNEWDIQKWEEKFDRQLNREINVWAALSHAHILELLGFSTGFGKYKVMVSPWCQYGTSSAYLRPGDNIDVKERIRLVTEVNEGLIYLHKLGIIHGDLKPENVLIDDELHARLCDFGLVRLHDWQGPAGLTTSSPYTGSARYKAPELFATQDNPKPEASMAGDVYALGCIVLEFVKSRRPYHDTETQHTMEQEIKNGKLPADHPPNQDLTDADIILWELMNHCWSRQYEQRPTARVAGTMLKSVKFIMDRGGII